MNTITKELNEWCVRNKLTVNTEKKQAMIISAKPFTGPLQKLSLGNDTIEFVTETRCLGINIDNRLKWNKQVKNVAKGFSAKVAQLKRLNFLPRKVLEEIYYKSVISCVVYAISVTPVELQGTLVSNSSQSQNNAITTTGLNIERFAKTNKQQINLLKTHN